MKECRFCKNALDDCVCEKLPEDHSGETLCESCEKKEVCEQRDNWEPYIFHLQYVYCHEEKGQPSFVSNEEWVNKTILGKG